MNQAELTNTPGISLWEDQITQLWCEVCAILLVCIEADQNNKRISSNDPKILELFDFERNTYSSANFFPYKSTKKIRNPYLIKNSQFDHHLQEGLFKAHHKRRNIYPRIASLAIEAFYAAKETEVSTDTILLPSPLTIIYSFLTIPEHACTAAYALTACRNWLCRILGLWPKSNHTKNPLNCLDDSKIGFLTEDELVTSIESFKNYSLIAARWPDNLPPVEETNPDSKSVLHNFVGHFLATRSFTYLWLNKKTKSKKSRSISVEEFLSFSAKMRTDDNIRILEDVIARRMRSTYFRKSDRFESLPTNNEFQNQLFGFPLPLKGMDVVFNGGLLPSKSGGLVMSLSGKPGTGKTSFALALANVLAPFGTATYFLALEETHEDIQGKLSAITPEFEKSLSITQQNNKMFTCEHPDGDSLLGFSEFEKQIMIFAENMDKYTRDTREVAGFCPAVIVVDNLNIMASHTETQNQQFSVINTIENIIRICRKLNAITILVSADDIPNKYRIDYLSDVVVEMRYEDLDQLNSKPVRIFNLIKTRHQLARQGSHVFHMGSGKGFRIVPHMDSLMDRKEIMRRELPDPDEVIYTLKYKVPFTNKKIRNKPDETKYLDIYPNSNILIHGFGSSGKAGFGLKLLLIPPVSKQSTLQEISKNDFSDINIRRRILVISFLYPGEYYHELIFGKKMSLHSAISNTLFKNLNKPMVDYMTLYPGYLGPQDLLNKVVSALDSARLEGLPYTGVMIDGLHNISLQYKKLQETPIVWAMLYSILSRYRLTVVSTFTNFSLNDRTIKTGSREHDSNARALSGADQSLIQEGMTPFLHALVKATDFYIHLQETVSYKNERNYVISVHSAIGQPLPEDFLLWDRQKLEVKDRITPGELDIILNGPVKLQGIAEK